MSFLWSLFILTVFIPEKHRLTIRRSHDYWAGGFVHFPRTKQKQLEDRQADVEYELRCLLNKPGLYQSYCMPPLSVHQYLTIITMIYP